MAWLSLLVMCSLLQSLCSALFQMLLVVCTLPHTDNKNPLFNHIQVQPLPHFIRCFLGIRKYFGLVLKEPTIKDILGFWRDYGHFRDYGYLEAMDL